MTVASAQQSTRLIAKERHFPIVQDEGKSLFSNQRAMWMQSNTERIVVAFFLPFFAHPFRRRAQIVFGNVTSCVFLYTKRIVMYTDTAHNMDLKYMYKWSGQFDSKLTNSKLFLIVYKTILLVSRRR